jgi:hypothetical protein
VTTFELAEARGWAKAVAAVQIEVSHRWGARWWMSEHVDEFASRHAAAEFAALRGLVVVARTVVTDVDWLVVETGEK